MAEDVTVELEFASINQARQAKALERIADALELLVRKQEPAYGPVAPDGIYKDASGLWGIEGQPGRYYTARQAWTALETLRGGTSNGEERHHDHQQTA